MMELRNSLTVTPVRTTKFVVVITCIIDISASSINNNDDMKLTDGADKIPNTWIRIDGNKINI